MREQETTGDFPGGLKDLDTDNPDVQDGADPSRSSTGSRSPTSTASASTPSSTSIAPRSTRNLRGFWGDFTDRDAREGQGARQAELLHLRRRLRRQRRADRQLHVAAARTRRATFGRFDSMFYFSQYYEGITTVFGEPAARAADQEPRVPLQLAHRAQPDRSRSARRNGYPAGPDLRRHRRTRTSGRRRHRPRAAAGAGQLPRQPRRRAVHVRQDRSGRSCAPR